MKVVKWYGKKDVSQVWWNILCLKLARNNVRMIEIGKEQKLRYIFRKHKHSQELKSVTCKKVV